MPPRFRSSLIITFFVLCIYMLFPRDPRNARIDGLHAGDRSSSARHRGGGSAKEGLHYVPTEGSDLLYHTAGPVPSGDEVTQEQYNVEADALADEDSAGKIYGSTLRRLVDAGKHTGHDAAALTPTESWTPYNDAPPYTYNPYPDYNSKSWTTTNKGKYVPCDGPTGEVQEVRVFSGHPEAFTEAPMGSYVTLGIDSNLCFERESRLAAYGYVEEGDSSSYARDLSEKVDWDSVNWGQLQDFCYTKNADRYVAMEDMPQIGGNQATITPSVASGSMKEKRIDKETNDFRTVEQKPNSRTALLLRTWSGKNYTENDRHIIRSLVSELSLRSGGEYQVYLLVQIKEDIPIWDSQTAYEKALSDNVPAEFHDMTILWNDEIMKQTYPLIPKEINNVHQSQWLCVQKFAQDHPQFDYFWNWELDSRYTGHHYNFLEKIAQFADKQPRKGLWERSERYYIPSLYNDYYDTNFRKSVENLAGSNVVWGPVPCANVTPTGPIPPTTYKEDNYEWGVDEKADYITLAPMFNPQGSNWIARDDVWGYAGVNNTPRRTTIGTQSRCSKKLLFAMHKENKKGNHVSSEMTPQTVALLHGFKAVYAPVPIFFDRNWEGKALNKWFNPGPLGVSGSTQESPFGWGRESRFGGSTYYFRADPPTILYNNWMGWEDSGIGGPEFEKTLGRACLPPLLLHPIKDVVKPPPGWSSHSDLPY